MENASKALIIAGAILISILLITIGIVLIRSGQSITDTGAQQMASQNIQTFNAQFTAYAGTIKGSQVKTLLETVRANNSTDKSHQVAVYSNADASKAVNETTISSTANYSVTMYYYGDTSKTVPSAKNLIYGKNPNNTSENGYVYVIWIEK